MPLFLIIFFFLLCGCHSAFSDNDFIKKTVRYKGDERSYIFYAPAASVTQSVTRPLIILLHGGTQSAYKVWLQTTLPLLARKHGFVLLAPDGINNQWNDGRLPANRKMRTNADDVGFIKFLITKMIAENQVNPSQVYITGASNGGIMAYRMLCEHSELFAGAAPVIATLPKALAANCRIKNSVPIMLTLGTADPFIPWDGCLSKQTGVNMLSGMETFAFFLKQANCKTFATTDILDKNQTDGSNVTRLDGVNCHTPVQLFRVNGGGHHWINTKVFIQLSFLLGKSNRDIDSGDLIWTFFLSH